MSEGHRILGLDSFALSNVLAAFGGGMILGKGVGVINISYLQSGSILAFFVGTILGLAFLQFMPSHLTKFFSRWFSIAGGITSLILLELFNTYSQHDNMSGQVGIIFFLILCIRFGFWFYSRVLRANQVAGQQQKIALVELGYYVGMILGLIIWKFLNINLAFNSALIIDALLQLSAGLLDLQSYKTKPQITSQQQNKISVSSSKKEILYEAKWGFRLAFAVVFLTIGVQVIVFDLAHQVTEHLGSCILATFYLGVAVAAFFCKRFNIELNWNEKHFAHIHFNRDKMNLKLDLLPLLLLTSVSVAFAIISIFYPWQNMTSYTREIIIYSSVFVAAFCYEIFTLAVLDRIGLEEKHASYRGMVMRTYGMMGIGAAISLSLMGATKSSTIGLLFTLVVCFAIASMALLKRQFFPVLNSSLQAIKIGE